MGLNVSVGYLGDLRKNDQEGFDWEQNFSIGTTRLDSKILISLYPQGKNLFFVLEEKLSKFSLNNIKYF